MARHRYICLCPECRAQTPPAMDPRTIDLFETDPDPFVRGPTSPFWKPSRRRGVQETDSTQGVLALVDPGGF